MLAAGYAVGGKDRRPASSPTSETRRPSCAASARLLPPRSLQPRPGTPGDRRASRQAARRERRPRARQRRRGTPQRIDELRSIATALPSDCRAPRPTPPSSTRSSPTPSRPVPSSQRYAPLSGRKRDRCRDGCGRATRRPALWINARAAVGRGLPDHALSSDPHASRSRRCLAPIRSVDQIRDHRRMRMSHRISFSTHAERPGRRRTCRAAG
jgi:hypothetical protein